MAAHDRIVGAKTNGLSQATITRTFSPYCPAMTLQLRRGKGHIRSQMPTPGVCASLCGYERTQIGSAKWTPVIGDECRSCPSLSSSEHTAATRGDHNAWSAMRANGFCLADRHIPHVQGGPRAGAGLRFEGSQPESRRPFASGLAEYRRILQRPWLAVVGLVDETRQLLVKGQPQGTARGRFFGHSGT